jgi:alpha-mannosidase
MKYMHSEWKSRLRHWANTLEQDIYRPLGNIQFEGHLTMDHLTLEEAKTKEYKPMPAGTRWGETYQYCWLRAKVTIPEKAAGKRVAMDLKTGGESTIFVDGQPFGTYRADWVITPLHFIVDNWLTADAVPGREYELYIEAYAGHFFPQSRLGGCATGPVMPGAYQDPKKEGERALLETCTFGIWNEDAYQLQMDVHILTQVLEMAVPESLRADKLAQALEQYTLAVDFEQDEEGRDRDYRKAREILKPLLEAKNGTTVPVFYAVGNAHLDMAWLWPLAETRRKTARTFAAQLRLLEEYPDYIFLQSQPASYEMCREHYPQLFEKVREAVKGGRWVADGAMYVEPDTNMTSGESLIRQLQYGKEYFKEVFDVDCQLLWLPDTFGYSAALPQILNGCGVKYLVTQKIFWSYNEGDKFPYHYFTWKGADGSAIDTFLPTSYTYRTDPKEIVQTWKGRVQKRGLDSFLLPYGYGDGGGGPCRDAIEMVMREDNLQGMPRVKHASPLTFFQDLERAGGPQHTYVGELYFSAHRGVYTSQARVKKGNRKSELALREAEVWGALSQPRGFVFPREKMDKAWKLLLLNQFHDILPGSSIARVNEEAHADHDRIVAEASGVAEAALQALVEAPEGASVLNSLSFTRSQVVTLPPAFAKGARTIDGEALPTQPTADGLLAYVTMPAMGAASLTPTDEAADYEPVSARLTGDGAIIENELITAKLNRRGEVVSLVDRATDQEYAAGPMNRFLMYKDVPRLFDAWDIDSHYELQPVAIDEEVALTVRQEGGLRAVIRLERKLLSSTLVQDITLDYGSRRLDFVTHVDWHEMHRLLKVSFPVKVQATEGINEIQFGYMKRPTHRSRLYDADRFEVCNQRYTALADEGRGAALLNDCKYGISMHDNDLRLTLLRGATCPEMVADQGEHTFTYSFTAWEGSFLDAPVVHEAYSLNVPPQVITGQVADFSAFELDSFNVFIDTVKPARDQSGDLILRLYEAKRADTDCVLAINVPARSVHLCDMLENTQEELPMEHGCVKLHFGTFEVKTLRIKR